MVLTFIGRASAQPRENFNAEDCLATALKAMVLQVEIWLGYLLAVFYEWFPLKKAVVLLVQNFWDYLVEVLYE